MEHGTSASAGAGSCIAASDCQCHLAARVERLLPSSHEGLAYRFCTCGAIPSSSSSVFAQPHLHATHNTSADSLPDPSGLILLDSTHLSQHRRRSITDACVLPNFLSSWSYTTHLMNHSINECAKDPDSATAKSAAGYRWLQRFKIQQRLAPRGDDQGEEDALEQAKGSKWMHNLQDSA